MDITWRVFKLNTNEMAISDEGQVALLVACGTDFRTEQEAQNWLQSEHKGEFVILPVYRS